MSTWRRSSVRIGHFLSYQGIDIRRHDLRDLYFQTLHAQQDESERATPGV